MRTLFRKPILLPAMTALMFVAPASASPKGAAGKDTAGLGEPRPEIPDGKEAFEKGKALFRKRFTQKEGLGPLFNDTNCAICHALPVMGGGGDLKHTAAVGPLPGTTEPTFFRRQITSGRPPAIPPHADRRIPPPLYGLGLIEAIPDEIIKNGCGSGHVNVVNGRAARFGYKPFVVTIDDFVSQAALTEMGVTSQRSLVYAGMLAEQARGGATVAMAKGATIDGDTQPDPEMNEETLKTIAAFVRGLQAPTRAGTHAAGEALFQSFGCASCHRPQTAPGVEAFSDLCLHHMGPALDDAVKDRDAGTDEYRTALLWGLRFRKLLLHDGRAHTAEEAIGFHAGEAAPAAERFKAATPKEKEDLLAFLKTL